MKSSTTGSQRCPRDGSAGHYVKKWRELGLFSLKKTGRRWDLFAVSYCPAEQYKRQTDSEVHEEMVRDIRHGLQQGKFWLDTKKKNPSHEWCTQGPEKRWWDLCPGRYSKFDRTRPSATWPSFGEPCFKQGVGPGVSMCSSSNLCFSMIFMNSRCGFYSLIWGCREAFSNSELHSLWSN